MQRSTDQLYRVLTLFAAAFCLIRPAYCQTDAIAKSASGHAVEAAAQNEQESLEAIAEITSELKQPGASSFDLLKFRGDEYLAIGKFKEAYDDYSRAIALTPARRTAFFVHQNRVWAAIGIGNFKQAVSDAQIVSKGSPPRAEAFAILALILAKSPDPAVRDPAAALNAAKTAASLDSQKGDIELVERALAAASAASGDFEAAVLHQRKAIASVEKAGGQAIEELKAYTDKKELLYTVPR